MKFSIVYLTYRPGGFDMLADSLVNQTAQNYELIVVDDCKLDRRDIVKRYLEEKGVNLKYIGESKKKCFPNTTHNFANALNTGILASTGDVILLMQDYSWLPPNCLERWMIHEALFEEDYCIAGAGKFYREEPEGVEKDLSHPLSVWKDDWCGSPDKNGWLKPAMWVGCPFELFYTAIPYNIFVELNGFQEWNDYVHTCQYILSSFIRGTEIVGGKIISDNTNVCEMINHRLWEPQHIWAGLSKNTDFIPIYHYVDLTDYGKKLVDGESEKRGLKEVSDWWNLKIKDGYVYSRPSNFPERKMGNCFSLKKHVRGDIYWEE